MARIPYEPWEDGPEHICNNLSAKQSLWGNAHLDLKCVLQVTLSSLKYPFILPEVIYPKDNGFLPLCLVYHCVPHVYSPQAFHLRTVSLWILLEFFLYLQPITPDVSSPAVNNFLLDPRAYSLEKAHSLLEFKIHMPDHIFSPWDFIASDQDSAEDRKGGKQCVFVFSFGFWFNLVKFLEKQLVTPFFLVLFRSEV